MRNLQKPVFALVALALVLLVNIRHSLYVYYSLTGSEISFQQPKIYYVIVMMLAIESLVVILAIHKQKTSGAIFSVMIGLINLYYYHSQIGFDIFFDGDNVASIYPYIEVIIKYVISTCLSVVSAYGIYFTTEIFVKSQEEIDRIDNTANLEKQVASLTKRMDAFQRLYIDSEKLTKKSYGALERQKYRLLEKVRENGLTEEEKIIMSPCDKDILKHIVRLTESRHTHLTFTTTSLSLIVR